jgi:excisionase family DNA binding protein
MFEKLLTRSQVADMLSISLRSVDRLTSRGILPAVRVLTSVRFREEDVRKLIDPRQGDGR